MASFAQKHDPFRLRRLTATTTAAFALTADPGPAPKVDLTGESQPSVAKMKQVAYGAEQSAKQLALFQPNESEQKPSGGKSTGARLAARVLNPLEPSGLAASTLMLAAGAAHGPAMLAGALAGLAFMPYKASAWMPKSTGAGYKARGIASDIGDTVQSFADLVMPIAGGNNRPMAQKIKGLERQHRDYIRAMNDILLLDDPKNPKMKGNAISGDQWNNMDVRTKYGFYRNGSLTLSEMGVNTDVLGTRKLDPKLSAPGVQFPSFGLG
jgi:hypothetical protein